MAYYDALVAKWATLTPGTTAAKLSQINAATVAGPVQKALIAPSAILNAIVFADLVALTALQISQLTLLLQGGTVDASVGTSIRSGIQTLFAGKTQTLTNLGALVAPYDATTILWWSANGYSSPVSAADLAAAGGLT